MSLTRLLACVALCLTVAAALADEPGKVTSQSSFLKFAGTQEGKGFGFVGICSVEIDDKELAAFGLYQAPGQKPQYTFLILTKIDPKSEKGVGMGGEGPYEGGTDGRVKCDLKLYSEMGGHEIKLGLQLDRDLKTVTKDVLTIGDKEYGKDAPRVFLVDLTADKPTLVPVKVFPTAVPDFADEKAWGKQILAAKREVIEKSKEAKELLGESK